MVAVTTVGALQTPLLLLVGDLLGSNLKDQQWRTEAACRGQNPAWRHPARGASIEPQKAVCRGRPVTVECLEYALTGPAGVNHDSGIWGGTSARDRRRARRRGWDARRLLADLD
jgi:hypothetical protein